MIPDIPQPPFSMPPGILYVSTSSNLKKENPPAGVDIPSGSAAMIKIIYKIQARIVTKPL